MAKNIIKLTESELHRIIKESVNKILKESITPYRRNERNPNPRTMDMLFEKQKQIVEYDLKKSGLNLPFVVRNYADWNIAVDIPVSAIKAYSEELVELYGNELAAVNHKERKRGIHYEPYEGYNNLSRLYTDDYLKGGMHRDYMYKKSELYQNALKDPNMKWTGQEDDRHAWYYRAVMPKPRKEYDNLRNEVLAIKNIMEKAGYEVEIRHENFYDIWDDENDNYSEQKFIRFILSSDELEKYRNAQYSTPEHQSAFERENEAERQSEMAYETEWLRRNGY